MTLKRTNWRALTLVVLVAHGCGGKRDDKPPPPKHDAGPTPIAAPIAIPKSGVDRIDRMNFVWGSVGSRDYGKALRVYSVKNKPRDWNAIKNHTEAALLKDPQHLGAHWLLASALAQLGDHAAAVDHLVTAIASDYFKYGVAFDTVQDLKPFTATQHGAAVRELAHKIRDDYKARVAKAILVVARRSHFRWPPKSRHDSISRGELYAYDRETDHYLRLTHTNDQVVGYVRAAGKPEIAVLTYDRMDRVGPDDQPVITRAAVRTLDADFKPSPKAIIDDPMHEIAIGYAPGDTLLVTGKPVKGDASTVFAYNHAGKLAKVGLAPPLPRIVFSLQDGYVVRVPTDVKAAWTGDPPQTSTLEVNGKKVPIGESGAASQSSIAVTARYVAYATAVDPCAKDGAPSLYIHDLEKGKPTHVLSGKSHFLTRWLDPTTLAYEDGEGQIRLYDATMLKQLPNPLVNKAGIAFDVLSLAGPRCRSTATAAGSGSGSGSDAGDGSGDEPPLPPED